MTVQNFITARQTLGEDADLEELCKAHNCLFMFLLKKGGLCGIFSEDEGFYYLYWPDEGEILTGDVWEFDQITDPLVKGMVAEAITVSLARAVTEISRRQQASNDDS